MKTICAWCGIELGGDTSGGPDTHGICKKCEARLIQSIDDPAPVPAPGWRDRLILLPAVVFGIYLVGHLAMWATRGFRIVGG